MDTINKLPLSFFEKSRPKASKNSLDDIEPIKWSKEVIDGKQEIVVNLPKKDKEE